jgi:curved DNA-binding protein CbpA
MTQDSFIDYYEILQVSPNADLETIERVYRFLAKRYHPDNPNTGDAEKFRVLTDAYHFVRDPEKRAAYDVKYEEERALQWQIFGEASPSDDIETDRRIQQGILSLLYTSRRREPANPGIGSFELERLLGVPEQHLEFHIWYLKEKGWIERSDTGKFAITVTGVEAVVEKNLFLSKDRLLPEGGGISTTEKESER